MEQKNFSLLRELFTLSAFITCFTLACCVTVWWLGWPRGSTDLVHDGGFAGHGG